MLREEAKIEVNSIPYIPSQVDLADLQANWKLLNDSEIKQLKDEHQTLEDNRYPKKDLNLKYGVIQLQNRYFAIYKGKRHNTQEHKYTLGEGNPKFKVNVKVVQDLDSGQFYALKTHQVTDPGIEIEKSEYKNLASIKQAIGFVLRNSPSKKYHQQNMIMELAPGQEFFDYVSDTSSTDMQQLKWIKLAIGLLEGAKKIHENKLLHCDIKLENIVYDAVSEIMTYIDFGFSLPISMSGQEGKFDLGTKEYIAPEIQKKIYSEQSDIYAAAKSLSLLLDLGSFFECPSRIELFRESQLKYNKKIPEFARLQVYDLLKKMMADDPKERPSLTECIDIFKEIHKKLVATTEIKTGLLDIKEFFESSEKRKIELINMLKTMDNVWLVDAKKEYNKLDYVRLRRILEAHKVHLGNKIFSEPSLSAEELVKKIPYFIESQESNPLRHYSFISGNKNKKVTAVNLDAHKSAYSHFISDSAASKFGFFINPMILDMKNKSAEQTPSVASELSLRQN